MPLKFRKPSSDGKCVICGRPLRAPKASYCKYCYAMCLRMSYDRLPPVSVKSIWEYIRTYDYVCFYTKRKLNMDNPHSPWYCVFDHYIPGDPRRIVLTSALVNTMKADMLEDEFWDTVFRLADYKRKGKRFIQKPITHWYRLYSLAGSGGTPNVTLSIPAPVLKAAQKYAPKNKISLDAMMTQFLKKKCLKA